MSPLFFREITRNPWTFGLFLLPFLLALGFLYLAFSGLALALLGALVFARRDR